MAYAAIVSLKQTIESLLHPSQSRILLPNQEVEFIYEELRCLQEKISSLQSSERVDALERQIKDAEDLIESHILTLSQELLKVKQEISFLAETLKKENYYTEDQQPSNSFAADAVSSRIDSGVDIKMVGLDNELNQLKRSLVSGSSRPNIISIVGMAGIGKTTLAKKVYHDPSVLYAFKHRCFVTIGPKYQLEECMLRILVQMGFHIEEMQKTGKLGMHLYRFLFSKRYLIVLDDVWNPEVWEHLRNSFPDNNYGSRIILTSRLVDIAHNASFSGSILRMPFLNDTESWNLLREKVFTTEESCSRELEEIGKQIAKNCEGLPLAIVAVGSLLRESEKTIEKWKRVAEDENSYITPILEALSLSYKQLPQHLKSCFLYMGVFPRNYEISISKLIQLWVAEEFFEPQSSKSLEEIAEECLADLVSRSLVLLGEQSSRGRTKTCRIHFVYRHLCVREAEKEKFFHIINKLPNSFPEGTNTQRRLCIHNNNVLGLEQVQSSMKSVSVARSLLCFGPLQHRHGLRVYLNYRLLKVLHALKIRFYEFPDEVLKLVQLRYMAITCDAELPESISRLWNLVVLIVHQHQRIKWSDAPMYLPMEIWSLHELRHLQCMGFNLPDPSADASGNGRDGYNEPPILENLLTLSGVSAHSCTAAVLARMPNLMKLGIRIESKHDAVLLETSFSFFGDFTYLNHLESFKCVVVNPGIGSRVVPSLTTFPTNLRKITLSGCGYPWKDMTYIGGLPNLEVLKLRCHAFRGPKWEPYEEEFRKLKFLLLEDMDLEHWGVDSEHFPSLKRLIIRHCYKLREIPLEFGDSPQLDMIELDDCSPSLVISVNQIQEEQQYFGNNIQVRIHSSWDSKNLRTMSVLDSKGNYQLH